MSGDIFFARDRLVIDTVLGSCVTLVLWHPQQRLAAMCHYILPRNPQTKVRGHDYRYADAAFYFFMKNIADFNTQPAEYEVALFGGSAMSSLTTLAGVMSVGDANVKVAKQLLQEYDFTVISEDVGGDKARYVRFDTATGQVSLKENSEIITSPVKGVA